MSVVLHVFCFIFVVFMGISCMCFAVQSVGDRVVSFMSGQCKLLSL